MALPRWQWRFWPLQEQPSPPTSTRSASSRPTRSRSNWLSHGRTYSEQRFSPLKKIDPSNIEQLGLAWSLDIKSRTARGVEATPIVVDGVMYTSGAWSHVLAIEAKTGKLLWEFDPQVPGEYAAKGCCDVVNRGVAVWGGKVFLGAFDGRLIALDAKTGNKVWETLTVDQSQDYTITGAPRVVKGKVIIGNGGAEFGVRGYVSAYDADTGKMAWRFYTVPGNPKDGFETKTVEMIAKTWSGEWWKLRRRRHGVGFDGLRPRPRPPLHRRRQRLDLELQDPQRRQGRQPVPRPPSSPSGPTPATTSGTSRPRRARTGTTPPPST